MKETKVPLLRISGGSVPGRLHVGNGRLLLGLNCQDAYHWSQPAGDTLAAVICDGCSQHPNSEAGAKLGSRILVKELLTQYQRYVQKDARGWAEYPLPQSFWDRLLADTLAQLRVMAMMLTEPGGSLTETIQNFFLFTTVGALCAPQGVVIFSVGDGNFALNGKHTKLGPFPNNRPPYLAYNMFETVDFRDQPELLRFKVQPAIAADQLQTLLLASDGADDIVAHENDLLPGLTTKCGPLSQFWEDPTYVTSGVAIRRRLVLMNSQIPKLAGGKEPRIETDFGLLKDDTTVLVIRRDLEAISDRT